MGRRTLRRWLERPAAGGRTVSSSASLAVDTLAGDYMLREETRDAARQRIPDIERIATRIVRLSASPNDLLLSLKSALEAIGPLKERRWTPAAET